MPDTVTVTASLVKTESPARQPSQRDRRGMSARETFRAPVGWLEAIKAEMVERSIRPVDLAAALKTKEPQISKLLNGKGMRALAGLVGDYLGIPPSLPCSSKLQARAMMRVKELAEARPHVLAKWMDALDASVEERITRENDPSLSHAVFALPTSPPRPSLPKSRGSR